ncbi:TonB family protein [Luteimonas soli]|uniref:TonB family protein n=1 Tax=Luteimonas soli TaxID=1648966 RepID=A0ABV7XH72_9GAMM
MKTAMFLSIALVLSGTAFAAPGDGAGEVPQSVYTYELELDGNGMISSLSPYGFTPDATSATLEHDIRGWLFHSGSNAGEGVPTLTYLRVVVQPEATADEGFEVVSATTGPAPVALTEPDYPVRDQLAGREGMVVLKLEVGADGVVDAAVVQATTSGISRPMAGAAVAAAQQWRFAPELVAGQAVPSTMLWPVCYVGRETSLSECSWDGPDMQRFSSKTVLPLDSAATLVSQR